MPGRGQIECVIARQFDPTTILRKYTPYFAKYHRLYYNDTFCNTNGIHNKNSNNDNHNNNNKQQQTTTSTIEVFAQLR